MEFRQNGIMFWEKQVLYYGGIAACSGMLLYDITLWPVFIPLIIGVLGLLIISYIKKDELIMVDQQGIFCHKGKNLLWAYQWSEIEELQIRNRFRNPSVEIRLKADSINRKDFDIHQCYFQLSCTAKKAIKQYYKWPLPRAK